LGLGAGFQFDFTHNIGLRVGYNFHSFGDSEVFGLNLDPGSMNGITSSLIFKF
jgi:opacity protein-like surface antigen